MKRVLLVVLTLTSISVSRGQYGQNGYFDWISLDSTATDPPDSVGRGRLYSNGVNGLFHKTVAKTGRILEAGDGIGASFQANEVLIGVTANDSLTGMPKVNNALSMITSSSGVPTWFTPSTSIMVYEDWPTNDTKGMNDWTAVTSGSGTVATSTTRADSNHPGVVRLSTTSINDVACLHNGTQTLVFGGGTFVWEALIYINGTSNNDEEYDFWAGFGDVTTTADMSDGIYIKYDHTTSANWKRVAATSPTRSDSASSIAVTTGWKKLRIVVDVTGKAEYFVDGVSIGTLVTNIPANPPYFCGMLFKVVRKNIVVNGPVIRAVDVDYAWFRKEFRTSR